MSDSPLDTVRLRVASTVSCTAAFQDCAELSVTYSPPCSNARACYRPCAALQEECTEQMFCRGSSNSSSSSNTSRVFNLRLNKAKQDRSRICLLVVGREDSELLVLGTCLRHFAMFHAAGPALRFVSCSPSVVPRVVGTSNPLACIALLSRCCLDKFSSQEFFKLLVCMRSRQCSAYAVSGPLSGLRMPTQR